MSIQSAAYRLAAAVRDMRENPDADGHLRSILEAEVDSALCAVDEALTPRWDGSEPCRQCGGRGVDTSPIDSVTCPDCCGSGKKNVQILGRVA